MLPASVNQRLRLASVAALASIASMRACDPMLLTLAAEFGRGLGEVSRVVSVFAIAYGLMQLFYGPLGDRIGKLRVVAFACIGCVLAALAAAFAQTLKQLVAARVVMGATAAGIVPMTIAWIGDQVPYEQRQETLARLLGATVSGMIAGLWRGLDPCAARATLRDLTPAPPRTRRAHRPRARRHRGLLRAAGVASASGRCTTCGRSGAGWISACASAGQAGRSARAGSARATSPASPRPCIASRRCGTRPGQRRATHVALPAPARLHRAARIERRARRGTRLHPVAAAAAGAEIHCHAGHQLVRAGMRAYGGAAPPAQRRHPFHSNPWRTA